MRCGLKAAALALSALLSAPYAAAATVRDDLWVTNGVVRAAVADADHTVLYIGGDFTYVGPVTGGGVALDADVASPGAVDAAWPQVNGSVYVVVADGSGGWYIGGDFTAVGGSTRSNLAHITAAQAVDAWAPDPDGAVRALAYDSVNGILYAGGDFTNVDGVGRSHLAALDANAASGAIATAWDPNANAAVLALILSGSTLYAGGDFTLMGGVTRNHLAALDTGSALASAWDPNVNAAVRALALSGGTLYAGGDFTLVGGASSRNHLAGVDTGSAAATAWDPNADAAVRALVLNGNILYAGGDFTAIDASASRNYLAALDTTQAAGNIDTGWDPNPNGPIRALALNGTVLYAGGDFTRMDALERPHLAALDTTVTTSITAALWNPAAGAAVQALAFDPGVNLVYAGGVFGSVGGKSRDHLAALDLASGAATAWDPGADGVVRTLYLSADGTTLYAGGDFTGIGGQIRHRLAALDAVSAAPLAWDPGADGSVQAFVPAGSDSTFFVGGNFSVAGGQQRQWLAELSSFNGAATSWTPELAGGTGVYALALDGETLYVGGDFQSAAGKPRNRLAAYDLAGQKLLAWAPAVDDGSVRILRLAPGGGRLYAGGDFTSVAGASQVGVVALDPGASAPLPWNPQANGSVFAITPSLDRTVLYLGGDFTSIAGLPRTRLAALAPADGSPVGGWTASADAAVRTLYAVDDTGAGSHVLYAGGDFAAAEGVPRPHLAALDALPPESAPPVTTATPSGGLYNSDNDDPIVLSCDDGSGSGCAATYFTTDGSAPTTASRLYQNPILMNSGALKFFSIDHAGNVEAVHTEVYEVESTPPTTTARPGTQVFEHGSLSIVLSCDDGGGSGCTGTYYTVDGTRPTTASPPYSGPITIDTTTVLQFFSVDVAGNQEGIKREEYVNNRSKIGALSPLELLIAACGLLLAARRRAVP